MTDKELTSAEKRAATKERKKKAMLENLGVDTIPKPIKVKRKRKPMTEEQRAAAAERLAIARSKKKPAKNTNVHPLVLKLPEDHELSYEKVKGWLKHNKDKLKAIKHQADSKESSHRQEFQQLTAYVKNLQTYLKDAVWNDCRYGENREQSMEWRCIAPAYDSKGNIKRTRNVFYDDIQTTWKGE